MPGPPRAIREGPLGVHRRKGIESRYFVLYEDRLDYFNRQEEAASGIEPRGRLALSDIRTFEALDGGLAFHLQSQTLVLSAIDGVDLQPWVDDLRAMVEESKDDVPWDEVDRRIPVGSEPWSKAARAELFERLDADRNGLVALEDADGLLSGLLAVRQEKGGSESLVPGLPPLGPAVQRAFEIAADIAPPPHSAAGAQHVDCRGFHVVLTYLRDYIEVHSFYGKAASAGSVDPATAEPLLQKWGIPPARVREQFQNGSLVKFDDLVDWLLWCKLTDSAGPVLDEPEDAPADEASAEQDPFQRMDRDGDGMLTRREFATGFGEKAAGLTEGETCEDAAVLCQGPLTMDRSGRASCRHVVLYTDRLSYYEDVAEFTSGKKPRGCLALADLEAVEETARSFTLQLRNAKDPVEFQADSEQENDRWLHAWALVLAPEQGVSFMRSRHRSVYPVPEAPAPGAGKDQLLDQPSILCEGNIDMIKKNKSESRYFVLFDKHFEYFNSQEEFSTGLPPRCRVALEDVQDVEVGCNGALFIQLAQGKLFELRASGQADARRWGIAWDKALSDGIFLAGAGTVSWGDGWDEPVLTGPASTIADAGKRMSDGGPWCPEEDIGIAVGPKVPCPAMTSRRLEPEAPRQEAPAPAMATPGARLKPGETPAWAAAAPSVRPQPGEAMRPEAPALAMALPSARTEPGEVRPEAPALAMALPSARTEPGEVRPEARELPREAAEAEAPQEAAEDAGAPAVQEARTARQEFKREPAVKWDLKVEEERVLHEGVVVLGRGEGNLQQRFAVVLGDRLEYTSDYGTATKVAGPRTRVMRSQICDAEVVDEGFNLELEDGVLLLRTNCEADQKAWMEALEAMLNEQDPRVRTSNGSAPPAVGPAPRPSVILQGSLGLKSGGQVEQRHCVLCADRLEYFHNASEAENTARPQGVIWKKDFTCLEVLDSDFVIHAGDRTVVLCTTDRAAFSAWQQVLLPMFSGTGDAAAPPRRSRQPALCQGTFFVAWGLGSPETEEAVALHADRLECGSGQIATQEIEDVEVCDDGFVFHSRDGRRVSLRAPGAAPDFEAWLAALGCVLDEGELPPAPAPTLAPALAAAAGATGSGASRRSSGSSAGSGAGTGAAGAAGAGGGGGAGPEGPDGPPRALCRTSSDLAAGPTRCVHEGPLELEPWRGQRKPRHAVLYGSKLDLFGDPEEADGGHPPCFSLPVDSILELRVLDAGGGFELRTSGSSAPRQLRVPTRRGFEEWRRAWGLVLNSCRDLERLADGRGWCRPPGGGGPRGAPSPPREGTTAGEPPVRASARAAGRWAAGRASSPSRLAFSRGGNLADGRGRLLHQGPLALVRNGRTEAHHFLAFRDRLEYFADAAGAAAGTGRRGVLRPAEIQEVRVLEHGFVLGMGRESLELHVASVRDMEVWVKVLRKILDPDAEPEGEFKAEEEEELEGMSSYFSQASTLGGPLQSCGLSADGSDTASPGASLREWLDSLQERPLHQGQLGFQDRGRLTTRFCVLFKDRLDCWDMMAHVSSKPSVRIMLSEVRGLEIISSGFVLNSRGRRTGVHVSNNEELQVWTRAMLSVLAPSDTPEAAPSTPQTASAASPAASSSTWASSSRLWGSPRSGGGRGASRAQSARLKPCRPKSPGSPRPRPGTSASKRSNAPAPFVPRAASFATPSAAAARGQSPSRLSEPSSRSVSSAYDPRRGVIVHRPQGRESGGEWACRDVAGKIVEPTAGGRSVLLEQREERRAIAEKVTGIGAARSSTAARGYPEICGKITEGADGPRGHGLPLRSRAAGTGGGEAVAPKVTEAGRVPMVSARTNPAHGMADKITQARPRRSVHASLVRSSSQPLGLVGHAPGHLA